MREEFLDTVAAHSLAQPVGELAEPSSSPGGRIGRYVVLFELGAGAMGVVLAAYDPELDRKVALKLLHATPGAGDPLRARLQHEAQALAKLDHPNVVAVHDVGEHGDQLFLGMEYVEGRTLRAWMDAHEGPRPWAEVLRVFIEAGRGLAAAHEAGLVHRDFKPDNVMVGDDGRVRVMDFGLARREEDREDGAPLESGIEGLGPDDEPGPRVGHRRIGAVMGTPAYMPLEQFGGDEVDARSDQFSFCVALYEVLYGERPFASVGIGELITALEGSQPREAPKGTRVPGWLRKVVVRGLAANKDERWPSMTGLLDALADDPALHRARWRAGAMVALLVFGVGFGAWYAADRAARVCTAMDAPLTAIWNDVRRDEIRTAIAGTQLSYGLGTWERIEPRIDGYARDWVRARVEACEATRRGEQSGKLLDLRMACLDGRLSYLRATLDVLVDADEDVVINAMETVASLPKLDRCADVAALNSPLPLLQDPRQARQAEALDDRLIGARTLMLAGKYDEGFAEVDAVLGEAEELGYEPLLARARLLHGELQFEMGAYRAAESTLEQAYQAALGQGMLSEAASAAATQIYVVGYALARSADGRRWALDSEPLAHAAGSDETLGKHLNNLGAVALREGKNEEARDFFARAQVTRANSLGPEHPETIASLENLGVATSQLGDNEGALRYLERSLAMRTKVLGPDHPKVAGSLNNLGLLAKQQGNHRQARVYLERSLAIKERALGPDHPDLSSSLGNLGSVSMSEGDHESARAYFERALAIREHAFGPDHPDLAEGMISLGAMLNETGKHEEARVHLERALVLVEQILRADHPLLVPTLRALGETATSQGRHEEARAYFERALALDEVEPGQVPLEQGQEDGGLGREQAQARGGE